MNKIIGCLICLFLQPALVRAGDEKNTVTANLKSATVYRSGAELTHSAKAVLKQGNNELTIEGLSNALDINSVQIGSDSKITIMSVAYAVDYLKPAVKSSNILRLEDSLAQLNKEIGKIEVLQKTDNELLDLLKANREIRGSQSGLSVAELIKMMDYYKTRTLEIQNEKAVYQEKENKTREIIDRIRQQITEEEQKNTKTTGVLQLQILSPLAGNTNLIISYITTRASWNPAYDIRVENINKPINLSYKAKIQQTTGIDWKQVKLILASSSPNQNNNAPILKSWFLSYTNPVTRLENNLYMNSIQSMAQFKDKRGSQFNEVLVTGVAINKSNDDAQDFLVRGNNSIQAQKPPVYVLDGIIISQNAFEKIDPNSIKNVEVLKGNNATALYGASAVSGVIVVTLKENLGDYISVKDNELNITYDIDLPYDVPCNGKEQNVALKELQVNCSFKYYAVPKLDKDAYLLGEIAEWEKLNLLAGEANIVFEGTYIGKTYIDPNSTQDTLNLTLGKDKRIVLKKEKLKDFSSVKFMGSNKKQVFTYEITVKNNKKEAIQLLLKDQYPLSTNKEIEVELLDYSGAANNSELGVLTWKLQLQPGETKKQRVSYSVKYPKDQYIDLGQ